MPVQALAPKVARTLYRNAKGRFISKAKHDLEKRRLATGRFGTPQQARFSKGFGKWMRAEVGPPGGNLTWTQIATKYPEKLEDWINEYKSQF